MGDAAIRTQLVELLRGGHAHLALLEGLAAFPCEKAGIRPGGSPHSAWELLEHLRIALRDIVSFSGALEDWPTGKDGASPPTHYRELKWPDDYWPVAPAPPSAETWHESVAAIEADLQAFIRYFERPENDLYEPFPWGSGQNLLHEALLIADHNSYHLGQIVLLRKAMA